MNISAQKCIMTWKGLLVLIVFIIIVSGIQGIVAIEFKALPPQAVAKECTVMSVNPDGKKLSATLDCKGDERVLEDAGLILEYIKTPKPLVCDLYAGKYSIICNLKQ